MGERAETAERLPLDWSSANGLWPDGRRVVRVEVQVQRQVDGGRWTAECDAFAAAAGQAQ